MNNATCKCKLGPLAFGLAIGIVWGGSVLITGLTAYFFSYGKPFVVAMSSMYIGYEPSIVGSIIGGVFGLLDGLIGGAIIALLYNCFIHCCRFCGPAQSNHDTCCDVSRKK